MEKSGVKSGVRSNFSPETKKPWRTEASSRGWRKLRLNCHLTPLIYLTPLILTPLILHVTKQCLPDGRQECVCEN